MNFVLPILLFLVPLLVVPLTPNYFATPKLAILALAIFAILVLAAKKLIFTKTVTFYKSPLLLPLILFALAILVTSLLNREGSSESFYSYGLLFGSGTILAYTASGLSSSPKYLSKLLTALVASTSLLALFSLLHLTFLYKLDWIPALFQSRLFTPTGSPVTTLTLLVVGIIVSAVWSLHVQKAWKPFLFIALALQTVAAVAFISLMLPGNPLSPTLLPLKAGWSITLDALKSPHGLFFGVGLANFPSLYGLFKPLFLNSTTIWNVTPPTAGFEILQLLATTGLIGFSAFALLLFAVFRFALKHPLHPTVLALLIASTLAFLLTPPNIPVTVLFFIALGSAVTHDSVTKSVKPWLSLSGGTLLFLLSLATVYAAGIYYLAEYHMFAASQALQKNDGKAVYENELAAVNLLPYMTNYHLSYSAVNMALASSMSQKGSLSDEDRSKVVTLVSQAIREAKTATSLKPSSSETWRNLGSVYSNLINVASGADKFALEAYGQAVAVDSANPTLRVEYGGLYYQLAATATDKATKAQYLSLAIQQFQTAVQLKPDYANGYYNLAKALEAAGDTQNAYLAMQKVVANVSTTSNDYATATKELDTLKAKLPKSSPAPSPSPEPTSEKALSTPSPLPSPLSGGPIILPETSASPTPAPSQ